MKKEKLNYMQKARRKAKKKESKEGIKSFCNSLKSHMLLANKEGRHIEINMRQGVIECPGDGDYIEFAEGDRLITVLIL